MEAEGPKAGMEEMEVVGRGWCPPLQSACTPPQSGMRDSSSSKDSSQAQGDRSSPSRAPLGPQPSLLPDFSTAAAPFHITNAQGFQFLHNLANNHCFPFFIVTIHWV